MIYEINFLVLQSKTAELEKIREKTKKFIETFDAKVVEEKEYLKRKLAYEIQHENYGFFTVLRFEFKGATNLDELKKKLNQKTDIARYIIVRADELPALADQDVKELEKVHSDKKSIKSEDLEKALTEQKKADAKKKEEKKEGAKAKLEAVVEKKEDKKVEKKKEAEKVVEEKPVKEKEEKKDKVEKKEKKDEKKEIKKEAKKEEKPKEEKKEKVSLDELDKKLDEILNS